MHLPGGAEPHTRADADAAVRNPDHPDLRHRGQMGPDRDVRIYADGRADLVAVRRRVEGPVDTRDTRVASNVPDEDTPMGLRRPSAQGFPDGVLPGVRVRSSGLVAIRSTLRQDASRPLVGMGKNDGCSARARGANRVNRQA